MFVPMWIVWVVVAVVALPIAYTAFLFLATIWSIGREAQRREEYDAMEHARWPVGDPRRVVNK